jgi:iron-sulfur cluster assembly protein
MFSPVNPVTISAKAADEIRKIMQTKNIPTDYSLRVGIRGGGCGGVSLIIGFDKKKDTDLSYSEQGIPVLVEKKHTMYIIGKEVDFYEGADARGFMFVDPNEKEKADQSA